MGGGIVKGMKDDLQHVVPPQHLDHGCAHAFRPVESGAGGCAICTPPPHTNGLCLSPELVSPCPHLK